MDPNRSKVFVKMVGQKDQRIMKRWSTGSWLLLPYRTNFVVLKEKNMQLLFSNTVGGRVHQARRDWADG